MGVSTIGNKMETTIQGLGFPKFRGTFLGGPHNKDYSILGSTLGLPFFWATTKLLLVCRDSLCIRIICRCGAAEAREFGEFVASSDTRFEMDL